MPAERMVIPLADTPLARILAHETAYWTTICEVEQRDGWKLFHNAAFAPRLDPNHAGDFRAVEHSGAGIVAQIVEFYEALGIRPVAYVDALATPHDLVPALLAAGFEEWTGASADLMLYVGPDAERPSSAEVVQAVSAQERSEWAAVIEEEAGADDRRVIHRLLLKEIGDQRITAYLARVDGQAATRAELFSSDGLGRVEAVRTAAAFRGRGLATAVVRQAVRASLAQGNDLTYIYAEPGGDAQRLYTRLGFRTVAQNLIRGFAR